MPIDSEEPPGPLTCLEDPRLAIDTASNMIVVGGSDQTDMLLHDAGMPVSRCATPVLLVRAFERSNCVPQIVVAPLLAPGFDILDVIAALVRLRFQGQLLAVSAALPDVGAVLSELRGDCAGFRLDILQVGG